MKAGARWKLYAASALSAATLALSAFAVISLSGLAGPVLFADTHDRRAYELLVGSSNPAALNAAAAQAEQALALSPYSNSARLRLVYIDVVRRGGSLGPDSVEYLRQSYDLVPFDYTVAAWRTRFALEHWTELPPELRRSAEAEAMAFARVSSHDADVRGALQSIQSPEGRLAAALWLRALAR